MIERYLVIKEHIHALAHKLRLTWEQGRADLLAFTAFLEDLSRSA